MSFIGDLGSLVLGAAYALRVPLAIAGITGLVLVVVVARRRGWARAARRHPAASASALAAVLLLALPLGWYLVSPVFLSTELQEAPIAAAGGPSAPAATGPLSGTPSSVPTATPVMTAPPAPAATLPPTPEPWSPSPARRGEFAGTDDFHFGRGTATLSEVAPGEWVVRFDDFAVRNGPDLYVYLSPDPGGYTDGAIEVARLRADKGSFNTPVPPGTDLTGVRSVLVWCKQFSHLFAVATLDG